MSSGPVRPVANARAEDALRDGRDGYAWIKSTIAYCSWRARLDLRPSRDRAERDAGRDYRDAIRLLTDILSTPARPRTLQLELPALNQEPGYTPQEIELMQRPTAWLVDALMSADPRYTLRRSLLHLRRGKLARMLVRAWAEAAAAPQAERRSA